jgi:hypothetical protein
LAIGLPLVSRLCGHYRRKAGRVKRGILRRALRAYGAPCQAWS